ncbi:MAG: TetR/AcrR family transcriptional regulator, partial [Lachnospiraceae bacterium]
MAQEKIDRRVRKTRALLLQGLIQLMNEKDIKDISVKELSDLVDINRGTFYLHYNDIYDMLDKVEDELFQEFNEILDRDLTDKALIMSSRTTLMDIFSFLEKHRDIAKVMLGPHGDLAFVNRLKELVKERLRHI